MTIIVESAGSKRRQLNEPGRGFLSTVLTTILGVPERNSHHGKVRKYGFRWVSLGDGT